MVKSSKQKIMPTKVVTVITSIITMIALMSFVLKDSSGSTFSDNENFKKDSVASVKAFMQVYKVLVSARCVNCHPAGNIPLQGDDSHLHAMLPQRGKDGKGIYAMKCTNCHQPTNIEGLGKPPGAPNWHLPPANMKMIFEGRTASQLAKQLVNPKTNGNKNLLQLKQHANDELVKAGWNMGERTKPPLTYDEFKKAWNTWIDNGAYAPKEIIATKTGKR
jgi:mono/diheme cytochrome c family protein